MPTVPTIKLRSVKPEATPTVFQTSQGATAEAFGGGEGLVRAGQQVQRVGVQLADVALRIRDQDDELDAKTRDVAFAQELQRLTFGDDQTAGFYSSRGAEAVKKAEQFRKDVEEARRKHLEGANIRVQRVAGGSFDARILREFNTSARFVLQERERAANKISDARQGLAISEAGNKYNDPKIVEGSLATAEAEVLVKAQRSGSAVDSVEAKFAVLQAQTVVVESAVNAALANDDPITAQKLLNEHGDKIDGAVRDNLDKALKADIITTKSNMVVTEALRLFPGLGSKQNKARRDYIRSVTKGKQQVAAINEFESRLAQTRKDKAETRADDDQAAQIEARRVAKLKAEQVAGDRNAKQFAIEQVTRNNKAVDELNINIVNRLTPTMHRLLISERLRLDNNEPLVTDFDAYTKFVSMSAKELRAVDLAEARLQLADPDFNVVRNLVTDALKGIQDNASPNSPQALFKITADTIDDLVGKPGSNKAESRARALKAVMDRVAVARAENKNQPLSTEAIQAIVDDVLGEVVLRRPGGDFGTITRFIDPTVTTRKFKALERLTPENLEKFVAETTKELGREPTDIELRDRLVKILEVK